MLTTFYFIRHSDKFDDSRIEKYNTTQSSLLKSEKIVLSIEGEKRAKKLSELEELQNIDKVYVSNCVRTLQTSKYLLDKQKLNVTIDERLDERRVGKSNSDIYPNWFELQYFDENFKTDGGESQKDVRERVNEVFMEALKNYRGQRIIFFAHGYSITFFLMRWVKLLNLTPDRKYTFEFNNEVIFDNYLNMPEIFKVVVDELGNAVEIKNIKVKY